MAAMAILLNVTMQYLKDKEKKTQKVTWTGPQNCDHLNQFLKSSLMISEHNKNAQIKGTQKRTSLRCTFLRIGETRKKTIYADHSCNLYFFSAKKNSLVNVVFSGRNIAVRTSISVTFSLSPANYESFSYSELDF
jgi:hypothetical protein